MPTKDRRDLLLLAFILFFPLLAAFLYFVLLAGTGWARPTYIVAKTIQFAFPLLYLHVWQRKSITITPINGRSLLLGLIAGILLSATILVAYYTHYRSQNWVSQSQSQIWNKLAEIGVVRPLDYLGLAIFLSVLHSLLEEYYWRWFVWSELAQRLTQWLAILVTNMAFALHHIVVLYVYIPSPHFWTSGILFSLAVMLGGIVWSILYRYTRSIYSAWLSHALVDGVIMYIGYDLCRSYWQ